MDIKELGESGLIQHIASAHGVLHPSIVCGIGDDAAALRLQEHHLLLASCDLLLEGVHFDLGLTDALSLGKKSLAVNLSDIAAMGGTPRFFLVSLGVPPHLTLAFIDDLYRGMMTIAQQFDTRLAGGDTNASPRQLVIDITVIGDVPPNQLIRRDGAGKGDDIWVTGMLGDAALGLHLLQRGLPNDVPLQSFQALLDRHRVPFPRVREGRMLAENRIATSMIDISDGLLADLSRLLTASGRGAMILLDRLPLSDDFVRCPFSNVKKKVDYALSGGEDYELLFTVSRHREEELRRMAGGLSVPITKIGEITDAPGLVVLDAEGKPYTSTLLGYDHFTSASHPSDSSTGESA